MELETTNVLKVEFCKSIIHSKAALTYAQAQEMLDDRSSVHLSIIQDLFVNYLF